MVVNQMEDSRGEQRNSTDVGACETLSSMTQWNCSYFNFTNALNMTQLTEGFIRIEICNVSIQLEKGEL